MCLTTIDFVLVAVTCITCEAVCWWKQAEYKLSQACPLEPLVQVQNIQPDLRFMMQIFSDIHICCKKMNLMSVVLQQNALILGHRVPISHFTWSVPWLSYKSITVSWDSDKIQVREGESEGRLLSLFKTFHYLLKIRVYFQKLLCWLFWMSCQCNAIKVAVSLAFRQVCREEGAMLSSLIPWQKDWDYLTSVWKFSEASYNGLLLCIVTSSTQIHEESLKVLCVVFSLITPKLLIS